MMNNKGMLKKLYFFFLRLTAFLLLCIFAMSAVYPLIEKEYLANQVKTTNNEKK